MNPKIYILLFALNVIFWASIHADFIPITQIADLPQNTDTNYIQDAIRAYQENNYTQALQYFLDAENSGIKNPSLYFNIGNAYYRNNDIPNAIVYYKKALLLDSSFRPARTNLDFMLSITPDKQIDLEENTMTRFVTNGYYLLSINTLLVICLIILVFIISLIHLQWAFPDRDNTIVRFINFVLVFIFILFTALTISRIHLVKSNHEAVVTAGTVRVYSGPSESNPILFTINEGTILKIQKEELNWTQITTLSGYSGWINADTYRKIIEN